MLHCWREDCSGKQEERPPLASLRSHAFGWKGEETAPSCCWGGTQMLQFPRCGGPIGCSSCSAKHVHLFTCSRHMYRASSQGPWDGLCSFVQDRASAYSVLCWLVQNSWTQLLRYRWLIRNTCTRFLQQCMLGTCTRPLHHSADSFESRETQNSEDTTITTICAILSIQTFKYDSENWQRLRPAPSLPKTLLWSALCIPCPVDGLLQQLFFFQVHPQST